MDDPNHPNINQEESNDQNNTGNMYSYKDDKNNINNPNEFQTDAIRRSMGSQNQNGLETGAIRRSMGEQNPNGIEAGAIRRSVGEGNPYNDIGKPNYNNEYGYAQNYSNNIPVPIQQSPGYNYNNHSNKGFLDWIPYIIFGCIEIIMIILIACLFDWDVRNQVEYSIHNENSTEWDNQTYNASKLELNTYDGLFRDINIFVFVGFGMLHTLLKRYSWTSITINMLAIVFSFQIGLFTNLLWENAFMEKWQNGLLNFRTFIKSIINSCSILVSLGCILGKLSSTQYLILIVIETILSSLNFQLCAVKLETIDIGGSLYIHTFGTIFGIAIYMVLFCSKKGKIKVNDYNYFNNSNYFSNITSFIGVFFLCFYFPSFNSGLAINENERYRTSINTYFSLTGSIVFSFIASALFNKGRFEIEHILFGCFSGGVAISGCCSVCIYHWAALLIGSIIGYISVICLKKLKPFFIKWGFYDIYNIIIIHGIPGLFGILVSSMMIAGLNNINENPSYIINNPTREVKVQAGIQIGAIFITLGISFVSGIATGYLMKISTCGKIEHFFTDSELFENETNIIDNLEQNQFYHGDINRASLFQNIPPQMQFDLRESQPSYLNK